VASAVASQSLSQDQEREEEFEAKFRELLSLPSSTIGDLLFAHFDSENHRSDWLVGKAGYRVYD
jgi:hypothetical protein